MLFGYSHSGSSFLSCVFPAHTKKNPGPLLGTSFLDCVCLLSKKQPTVFLNLGKIIGADKVCRFKQKHKIGLSRPRLWDRFCDMFRGKDGKGNCVLSFFEVVSRIVFRLFLVNVGCVCLTFVAVVGKKWKQCLCITFHGKLQI